MRIHFRRVKDFLAVPLHWLLRATSPLPLWVQRAWLGFLGALVKAYYCAPASHVRRTLKNFCRISGRRDPRRIYFALVDNVVTAALAFGRLMRSGRDAVADMVAFDEASLARLEEARRQHGACILVVPHCAGSVLSAAGFASRFPTVVLVRESKSLTRSRIMRQYLDKLGAELLFVRREDPATIARRILKAIHEKKFIIGTTDLARQSEDSVEVQVFGQRVSLPGWPARFSSRRKVPILPGYIRMNNGRIVLTAGEPYLEHDLTAATQRWASFFEQCIRRWPSDWLFMFDKRWSRVLARAAQAMPPA